MSEVPEGTVAIQGAELQLERRFALLGKLAWLPAALLTVIPLLVGGWGTPEEIRIVMAVVYVEIALVLVPLAALASLGVTWLLSQRRHTAAAIDAQGLTLEPGSSALTLSRDDVALAWAIREHVIEVFTHAGDRLRIVLKRGDDRPGLVHALRAMVDGTRAYVVPLESPYLRTLRKVIGWAVPVALGSIGLFAGWAGVPFFALGLAAGWAISRGTPRVRLGADGVEIHGRFRTRYVPFREMAEVETRSVAGLHKVRLLLQSGKRVTVARRMTAERSRLLAALLEEGSEMVAHGEAAGAFVPSLERGAEDDDGWHERLATVTSGGDYRGAAIEPDRLLALMRNPAAEAEQRVAAALALRKAPQGRARIRVAAEVSTDPEVTAALSALAEEEIDEPRIRRTLSELGR